MSEFDTGRVATGGTGARLTSDWSSFGWNSNNGFPVTSEVENFSDDNDAASNLW